MIANHVSTNLFDRAPCGSAVLRLALGVVLLAKPPGALDVFFRASVTARGTPKRKLILAAALCSARSILVW